MSAHRGQVGFGLELRAVQYEVGQLRHLLEERKVGADTQCQVVPSCWIGMWAIAWNWLTKCIYIVFFCCFSSPRAESARAVTGRRCPHGGVR